MSNKIPRTRQEFRLPSDLVTWAKAYARRKNMNFSQLVVTCLTELKEGTEK